MDKLRRAFQDVRKENLRGRLYPFPDDPNQRAVLDSLVECDLVMTVECTPTSLGGYVAHGVYGFAAVGAAKVAQA